MSACFNLKVSHVFLQKQVASVCVRGINKIKHSLITFEQVEESARAVLEFCADKGNSRVNFPYQSRKFPPKQFCKLQTPRLTQSFAQRKAGAPYKRNCHHFVCETRPFVLLFPVAAVLVRVCASFQSITMSLAGVLSISTTHTHTLTRITKQRALSLLAHSSECGYY
jgi:hypothetical protein